MYVCIYLFVSLFMIKLMFRSVDKNTVFEEKIKNKIKELTRL